MKISPPSEEQATAAKHSGNSLCLEALYLQIHLKGMGLMLTCTKEPTPPSSLDGDMSCILQPCPGVQNGTH